MQPPRPRPAGSGVAIRASSDAQTDKTHHGQEPPDLALADGAGAPRHVIGTRDPALVQAWAAHHGAEPATGEATDSGPATTTVNDQGTGLRFNFPGAARFRPIAWDEWLAHMAGTRLVLVVEAARDAQDSSYHRFGGAFYRLVTAEAWGGRPLATLEST